MHIWQQYKGQGFSYIEMIFAVAMLAVLAAVATPYLEKQVQRKKEVELRQHLREIRAAIDAYKDAFDAGKINKGIGDSGYPKTLNMLVEGVEDQTSPEKSKLYFIRRIPVDPMYRVPPNTPEASIHPADTWGKRSYASDADSPREGGDVFDIYSMSDAVGLNGIPYRQW
jgi:general secretion pathway protein G